MILLSLTRQSVSIPWPWVSLKFYQVRHGSLFPKEAQGQMDKLNKFVHSLATVFFYLVEKGSCYCLRCFGWMQANFTLCFPVTSNTGLLLLWGSHVERTRQCDTTSFWGQPSSTSTKVPCAKPLGGTWRITAVFRILFVSSPSRCLLFCFHSSLKSLLICMEMRQEEFAKKYQNNWAEDRMTETSSICPVLANSAWKGREGKEISLIASWGSFLLLHFP